jgi:uncharacterized membrane protein (DUF441 family)
MSDIPGDKPAAVEPEGARAGPQNLGVPATPKAPREAVSDSNRQIPTIETTHANVEWANRYRLELIKLVLTLATGVLAFTVTFRPSLKQVDEAWLMWAGWLALAASIVGGMIHMQGWDRFYISYRDYDHHGLDGISARDGINFWRRAGMALQYAGFAIGVLAIGVFAALNLGNVSPPKL